MPAYGEALSSFQSPIVSRQLSIFSCQFGMVHFLPEIGLHFLHIEKLDRLNSLAGTYQLVQYFHQG